MSKSPDAFRTISEVADWLGIPAHVLRFWESKFAQVKPVKRAGGRRYYRPADMLLIGGLKKVLHEDGLTIKGAQKLLREKGVSYVADQSQPLDDLTMAVIEGSEPPKEDVPLDDAVAATPPIPAQELSSADEIPGVEEIEIALPEETEETREVTAPADDLEPPAVTSAPEVAETAQADDLPLDEPVVPEEPSIPEPIAEAEVLGAPKFSTPEREVDVPDIAEVMAVPETSAEPVEATETADVSAEPEIPAAPEPAEMLEIDAALPGSDTTLGDLPASLEPIAKPAVESAQSEEILSVPEDSIAPLDAEPVQMEPTPEPLEEPTAETAPLEASAPEMISAPENVEVGSEVTSEPIEEPAMDIAPLEQAPIDQSTSEPADAPEDIIATLDTDPTPVAPISTPVDEPTIEVTAPINDAVPVTPDAPATEDIPVMPSFRARPRPSEQTPVPEAVDVTPPAQTDVAPQAPAPEAPSEPESAVNEVQTQRIDAALDVPLGIPETSEPAVGEIIDAEVVAPLRPRVVDVPPLPVASEISVNPSVLTAVSRLRSLTPEIAREMKPQIARLTRLCASMASARKETPKD
ncbi:MAG: MerR family transcriptional regulator [Roseobacter sp.]